MIVELEEDTETLRKKLIRAMEKTRTTSKMLASWSNIPSSTIYNVMYGKSSKESLIKKLITCVEKHTNEDILDGNVYIKSIIAIVNASRVLSIPCSKKFLEEYVDSIYVFAKNEQEQENINAFTLGVITSTL
jgi:predicted transcriptional regulator